MAIIKNKINGSGLTGSVGDTYYRVVNGKQIVSSKPASYKLPKDERSVMNRNNMKILSLMGSAITRGGFFRELWKNSNVNGIGPFHKFVKFNHPGKEPVQLENIKLAPSAGINLEVASFSGEGLKFNVVIKPFGEQSGINLIREPFISAGGFFIDEVDLSPNQPFRIFEIPNTIAQTKFNEEITINISLNDRLPAQYKVLLLISTLNSTDQIMRNTETFLGIFNNNI